MGISLGQPLALLLLLPVLGSVLYLWRRSPWGGEGLRGYFILALRMLLLSLLILALASPSVRHTVNRQAVVFVADLSASADQQRAWVEEFVRQAMEARGRDDRAGVVAIGRDSLVEWPVTGDGGFREFQSDVRTDNTNLADGLRMAAALLPADARRRIVLVSDGQENLGNAVEQARFLQAQGVQVDVVPLEVSSGPEVLVASIDAPSTAGTGERVPFDVTIGSTGRAEGILQVSVDGAVIAARQVVLDAGETRFAFDVGIDRPGFHTLRATVDSSADTRFQNNRADALVNVHGPPTVLVVEDREGAGRNISDALRATSFQVEVRSTALFPESLEELGRYTGIVLVDVPAESLGQSRMEVIRAGVRDLGKGLLVVGGAQSFTMGEYQDTPLEEVLPVTSKVREREEKGKVALGLVIDKSGSMSGPGSDGAPKVEMAKEAARLSLEELETYDLAGVVAFDTNSWWLVPMGEIGSEAHLRELQDSIGALVSHGGTNIYAALSTAYQGLASALVPRKHMILLTDGISGSGDYTGLLLAMKQGEITLSTIAVGMDADVGLLQWLAEEGGGRFYFTDRAWDIPQILTKETRLATRRAIVEEPTTPLVVGSSPVLREAGDNFPTLGGYVTTVPRNSAHVVLVSPRGDPILAQWQHGLGRSVAWTSDSEGRWTSVFNTWKGVPVFWSALVNWTMPPEETTFQVRGEVEAGMAALVVEGEVQADGRLNARIVGPQLDVINIPVEATAPGHFEAEFPANEQGPYMVQVVEEAPGSERRFTAAGLVVPYSPEYRHLEANPHLLERVAAVTNGRVLSSPSEAFGQGLPPAHGHVPMTWWLLMAAVLLLPLDIALRRLNISLNEAKGWLETVKGWALKDRVTGLPEDAPSVLESIRQHRVGRPALVLDRKSRRDSRVVPASPSGERHANPDKDQTQPLSETPELEPKEEEVSEFATERWLRAKRRASNR